MRRCWECNGCVCHRGFWLLVCWADCRLGHRSWPLARWVCGLHDKHIWTVADGRA